MTRDRLWPLLAASLALGACATTPRLNTRIFDPQELADMARGCGIAAGEVVQEPDEPRILFLYTHGPSPEQLACVKQWSRDRNVHLAHIEGIEFQNAPSN